MPDALGKVYLVGAGPGDPELLTLRGKALLARAQVVVYDSLVNEDLLKFAPQAEIIFAGKRADRHALTQEDINRILIEQAARAACVVRLKGGDPFVFGRGGEEALALNEAGVPFEVVPGVTAGIGVPAYAGIPVTHRDVSSSVAFITGHRNSSTAGEPLAFDRLHLEGTLAFYMGTKNLGANLAALVALGRAPDTPAAAIERGTYARQRTIVGTLATLAERCASTSLAAPALVVVGEVVALRDGLGWFESRPLYGRRVAVTRTRQRAGELVNRLRELGADVFEFPTVEIAPEPAEPLGAIADYDWIVLTSVNGVDTLFERMRDAGLDVRDLHGLRLCAISDRTARALRERFLNVDAIPERYETDSVVSALEKSGGEIEGKKFLLPRADVGRSTLPEALRARGGVVTELKAYRTVMPRDAESLADALTEYRPDVVTFGSAVAARNFHEVMGADRIQRLGDAVTYAAIGPIARKAAQSLGLDIAIEPEVHRVQELADAIADWARTPQ